MKYADFLGYLHTLNGRFFIEVEAKPDKMNGFIEWKSMSVCCLAVRK